MNGDKKLSIVFLDSATLGDGDVSFDAFTSRWDCEFHDFTAPGETRGRIAGKEIVVSNKVLIDEALMDSPEASGLKLIAIAATGTNNVDLEAARARGISVRNVAGYSTASVVQHTFALLLELASHPGAYTADVRGGAWERSPIFTMFNRPLVELAGKTMGIVGYGSIGKAVEAAAKGFGMRVIVAARPGSDGPPPAGRVSLDELLKSADVVSLHCPLTPATTNLIGERELSLMKPTAFLINVARGGVVNEEALVAALKEKRIAGAGVDVITKEPPPPGHVLASAAKDLDNLAITPHNAWASREARVRLLAEIAANIQAFEIGEDRNNVV